MSARVYLFADYGCESLKLIIAVAFVKRKGCIIVIFSDWSTGLRLFFKCDAFLLDILFQCERLCFGYESLAGFYGLSATWLVR